MNVGGRRATLQQLAAFEACAAIGGQRETRRDHRRPHPGPELDGGMRACLRGPSLVGLQAQVEAMLATVTWNEPAPSGMR